MGIALESRRLDKLEETVEQSQDRSGTLVYALKVSQELVVHKGFRQEVNSVIKSLQKDSILKSREGFGRKAASQK